LTGRRRPTTDEFSLERQIVRRSGVVDALSPRIDASVGRPRQLPLEALLVAFQINALQRSHQAHLIDVARLLNALDDEQRGRLGIKSWDEEEAYERVTWLFGKLCRVLESGVDGLSHEWFANAIARASVPKRYLKSKSVAVDGTDVETWGAFQGSVTTIDFDGEAADTQLIDGQPAPPRTTKRAKVLAIGDDGRKQYTPDRDARVGHRSSNGQHNAGSYIGYELHLAVQVRDVRWTDYVERTTLGPEVPQLITTAVLAPAGTHRAKSVVGPLIAAKQAGYDIDDVVWDPGYSLCTPETTTYPLSQAGIGTTFQLVMSQRGIRPFSKEAILMDGQLYSSLLPRSLRDLATAPMMATGAYRRAYEEPFNKRARWRLVRHAGPDKDGVTRWRCPFCAGLLRSRNFPETMRRSLKAPLVMLPASKETCCCGTVSAPPADLPLAQRIPFGTTAWRISMNRRMAVESVNAALKGGYVNLARGFFRVFGLVKITALLGFTIAAVNLDRIRSHEAKLAEQQDQPARRKKRRVGTWRDMIGHLAESPSLSAGPTG
jgi:hypothetical protein